MKRLIELNGTISILQSCCGKYNERDRLVMGEFVLPTGDTPSISGDGWFDSNQQNCKWMAKKHFIPF